MLVPMTPPPMTTTSALSISLLAQPASLRAGKMSRGRCCVGRLGLGERAGAPLVERDLKRCEQRAGGSGVAEDRLPITCRPRELPEVEVGARRLEPGADPTERCEGVLEMPV